MAQATELTTCILLVTANDAPDAMAVPAGLHAAGIELRHLRGLEAAGAWMARPQRPQPDAILLGADLTQPLAAARRLRQADPAAQIIFIRSAATLRRFADGLAFLPGLAEAWVIEAEAPPERLHRMLARAGSATRARRRSARLAQQLNKVLTGTEPGEVADAQAARLAVAHGYLESILAQVPDPLFATDLAGLLIACNDAASGLFGRSLDDCVGMPITSLLPVEGGGAAVTQLVERAGTGATFHQQELRLRRSEDREPTDLELSLAPVRDADGRIAGVSFVARDVTTTRRTEAALRAALAEREVLIREIHHRVKNNLQVLASLLQLQARHLPEELRRRFEEAVSRVRAIARIHDRLAASADLAAIDFQRFVEELCRDLARSFGASHHVHFDVDVASVRATVETATPLALLLNELVSNALKHAFPADRPGRVSIVAARSGVEGHVLTISDDGVGLPEGYRAARRPGSLGLDLVEALLRQLGARMELRGNGGTTFLIALPATLGR